MSVPVAMIAAIGENRVIGNGGQLPWRLPSDFAFFKRTTLGKPLIMGRKTFESIGKPLSGRANIVISRQAGFPPDGVTVCRSLPEALDYAQRVALSDGATEVMIGGGAEIYRAAMPLADLLYITHVSSSPDGDAQFPAIDPDEWKISTRHAVLRTDRDSADFTVLTYARTSDRTR